MLQHQQRSSMDTEALDTEDLDVEQVSKQTNKFSWKYFGSKSEEAG